MKSWRQKRQEKKQKQQWLDEIHVRPNVKKVFILTEIFATFEAFLAMAIVAVILYGLASHDYSGMSNALDVLDLETFIASVANNAAGLIGLFVAIIVEIAIKKCKDKYTEELEVLEELGLKEIRKAVEEGTYVPGPTVSRGYRIFRGVRTGIAVFVFVPFSIYSIISFFV